MSSRSVIKINRGRYVNDTAYSGSTQLKYELKTGHLGTLFTNII